jgi:transposase
LRVLKVQILEFDRRIIAWHRSSATSKRLDAIPGVGPALATALVASVADANAFRSGRDFSAWVGLVPKQNSSGGKDKLGSISKQGDRYLRSLFTAGALAVIRYAKIHGTGHRPWLTSLLARRPTKVAAIALANKLARMAWAMMARNECYKNPPLLRRERDHSRSSGCDVTVGRVNSTNAAPGRSGDQDNPLGPQHRRMRAIDRDLIRGGHYGQRSREPR